MFGRITAAAQTLVRLARFAGVLDQVSAELRPYTVVFHYPNDSSWPPLVCRQLAPTSVDAVRQAQDRANADIHPDYRSEAPRWAKFSLIFEGWPEQRFGVEADLPPC